MEIEEVLTRVAPCIAGFEEEANIQASHYAFALAEAANERCESEIEKIFYMGWLLRLMRYWLFGRSPKFQSSYESDAPSRVNFEPYLPAGITQYDMMKCQHQLGDYRVDFALRRFALGEGDTVLSTPIIVVECDGHEFHERTKEQATRDKERDRLLQSAGHVVLRFTGSELWREPEKCIDQVDDLMSARIEQQRKVSGGATVGV